MSVRKISLRITFPVAVVAAGMGFYFWARRSTAVQRPDAAVGQRVAVEVSLANRTLCATGFPVRFCEHQRPSARNTAPYVLALAEGASKIDAIRTVQHCGARVIGPLPPKALLVETSIFALAKLSTNRSFAAASEWLPKDKLDSRLSAALTAGDGMLEVTVVALASEDVNPLVRLVAEQGGERLRGCLNGKSSVTLKLPATLVRELAQRGDVRWLEPFTRPKLRNDVAVGPTAMNVRTVWNSHGLTGEGQTVTTSDSGIDTGNLETMHADLRNRVIGFRLADEWCCYSYDANGHGTHTAGSIVGDGTLSDGQIRGMAYGAKLWAWFCGGKGSSIYTPGNCDELFRPSGATNACIHSASWGSDDAGTYSSQCADMDDYVWEHPDFLPVIANGNSGSSAQTVGSPATAKNVLAVGATQNARTGHDSSRPNGDPSQVTSFSSRGPCADGRIKPDVCAPGAGVVSTRAYGCSYSYGVHSNTNYAYDSGTSMATPLTAGAATLVRQWLVERRGFTNAVPTAALVKAVLTGGARNVTTPNNSYGWGCIDLGESLYPSNRAVRLIDRIPFSDGADVVANVVTLTNPAPFDVQLVWIDYAATAGASKTLVNDLDLIVSNRTTGAVRFGNEVAGGDHTNNVESVRIAEATTGEYAVIVRGYDVSYDSTQGGAAALYLRGAFDAEEEPAYEVLRIVSATPSTANVAMEVGTTNEFSVVLEVSSNLTAVCSWQLDGETLPCTTTNFAYAAEASDRGSHQLVFTVTANNGSKAQWTWTVSVMGELYVDAEKGDDATATGEKDHPYATIAAALAQAAAGEVIRVGAGTYAGGLVMPAGAVRIVAEFGPASTIIDGGGTNRCFDASASTSTVLSGFTLTNGASTKDYGGGVLYGTLSNCVIRQCFAKKGGGGACDATLTDCVIVECTTDGQGGGAYESILVNCTVRGNQAGNWRNHASRHHDYDYGGGLDYQCLCENTIVWGNVRSDGTLDNWERYRYDRGWQQYEVYPELNWCCTTPICPSGVNSITNDPLFASDDVADPTINELSACIGAGNGGVNIGAYRGNGASIRLPEIDVKTATGEEVSNAVASVGYVDSAVAKGIGTNAETYAAFQVWSTNGLKATAVVLSTRAYDSFLVRELVAAPTLLGDGKETKIELTALEPSSDGTCSTTVRLVDGEEEVPLCSVKAAFAARTRVGTEPSALQPASADAVATESIDEGRAVKLTITPPSSVLRYFLHFQIQ